MGANQASFPIATMARVLARSACECAWRVRGWPPCVAASPPVCPRPGRCGADRAGAGHPRRLAGVTTARRDKETRPAPDRVDRDFTATAPDQSWVADIAFVSTATGFLHLAAVLDAWSRKPNAERQSEVVGWAMTDHLRAELALDALETAIGQRGPRDVIHHSDQGSRHTSLAFGKRCREAGVRPSMGSVGDAHGNAMCESFSATLERELLNRHRFAPQAEARMARLSFVDVRYNPARPHSALGHRSPMACKATMEETVAEPPSPNPATTPPRQGNITCSQAPKPSTEPGQSQFQVGEWKTQAMVAAGLDAWPSVPMTMRHCPPGV